MKRFTQKNNLVTLNEINITPLLDLAFVLLIIFVITTPLLENSIDLNLPKGGTPPKDKLTQKDIRTIEVSTEGRFKVEGKWVTPQQLEQILSKAFAENSKL